MKAQTYAILSIVLIIIVSIFAVLNVGPVEVNYFFWKGDSPLILVILFSVLMGGLITGAAGFKKNVRLQRENKRLRSESNKTETSLIENEVIEEPVTRRSRKR